jgi:hypothetical protein
LETKSCFGYECVSLSVIIHLHLCQQKRTKSMNMGEVTNTNLQ